MTLNEYAREKADRVMIRLQERYCNKELLWLAEFVDYWTERKADVNKYSRFIDGYQMKLEGLDGNSD